MINRSVLTLSFCASALVAAFVFNGEKSAEATPVARRVPKTVEIQMVNNAGGTPMTNRFLPAEVTIIPGDTVKWVAVSGNHNIAFWKDSIPAGAEPLLLKAIEPEKDTTATLRTKRYPTAGTGFTMVFTGFPKGTYKYYCSPHLMRGMIATITVQ